MLSQCPLSPYLAQNNLEQLSKLSEHGFCVMDDFLPKASILALALELTTYNNNAKLHEAGTGQVNISLNKAVRGDSIYWLDALDASVAQQVYFKQMALLQSDLNQHLYLGIFALESHLALYPIGAGYKKHIDRFKTQSTQTVDKSVRQISCILYLNENWLESDGGHLRLYFNESSIANAPPLAIKHLDIAPISGRLVMFLSDIFYHEVMPANKARLSLTGWFLTRQ